MGNEPDKEEVDKQGDPCRGTKGKVGSPNFKKEATNKQYVKFKGWCKELSSQVYDRIRTKQAQADFLANNRRNCNLCQEEL